MEAYTLAFLIVLFITFVDQVGISFVIPIIVPYGRYMGADHTTIAYFSTVRGLFGILAAFWMPLVSDRYGRRSVVLLALFGRAVGYFVQGIAAYWPDNAIGIFIAGRALAGLFSGTSAVISAYLTELFGHNKDLLSNRLVFLQVYNQIAGIALQPVAGALAEFSLQLPFLCVAALGAFALVWASWVFREASEVVKAASPAEDLNSFRSSKGGSNSPKLSPQDVQEESDDRRPWFDAVIQLCFLGFFTIFLVVISVPFLVPIMLQADSFGLRMETDDKTLRKIALTQSLVVIPSGICQIFTTSFLFIPASRRVGQLPLLIVAGLSSASMYIVIGSCVTEVWHLAVVQAFQGMCFGFLLPMIGPLIARYSHAHYRSRMAECQAAPMFGGQIASTVGQNFMAFVFGRFGLFYCWIACAAFAAIFMILLAAAFLIAERRAPRPSLLTSEQRKHLLQAGGDKAPHPPEDIDVFIDSMCQYVRETLNARRDHLWNGTAQFLYRHAMQQGLQSKFREWRDETKGREYLTDMHRMLQFHPTELEDFCNKFPHIAQESMKAINEMGNSSFAFHSVGQSFAAGFPFDSGSFSLPKQSLHASFIGRGRLLSDIPAGGSHSELTHPLAFQNHVHRQRTH